MVAKGQGLPDARFITYPPPNIAIQTLEEIQKNAEVILDDVIKALTEPVVGAEGAGVKVTKKEKPREIVFRGTLDEVNDFFYRNHWTDGLPIIPPTIEAVEAMLKYTDRSPDEVLGLLPPAMSSATVWKIAVNGVMAGCRPEYMPLLLALVEAIADPRFELKHAGSTLGWTPLIILNGPVVKELEFNFGVGVLRPCRQANITVSRFLRLCMSNIAGFMVGTTDMGTFGRNYHAVLAEAEDESPWEPLSVERGFKPGSSVVTVLSESHMSYHFIIRGTAEQHLQKLAREVARELGGPPLVAMNYFGPEWTPVICITPLLASRLAEAGYSKSDVKQYLYEHARITASNMEEHMQHVVPGFTVCEAVRQGKLDRSFCATEDPNRLIPVVHNPDEFQIVVTGHSNMSRAIVIAQLGFQGLIVSKQLRDMVNKQDKQTLVKNREMDISKG